MLARRLAVNSILAHLPPELIYMILERMAPGDLVSFIFATYPILRVHDIVHPLETIQLRNLVRNPVVFGAGWPFPNEVTLQILGYLRPREVAYFLFQRYWGLRARGLTPLIDRATFLILLLSLAAEKEDS